MMNLPNLVIIRIHMKSTQFTSFSFQSNFTFPLIKLLNFRSIKSLEHNLLWTTPSSFKEVESSGILAGVEENGNKVFVGRSIDRDGNYVVAKVVPELNAGFFAYNDTEESVDNVEFLGDADNYHWVKSDGEKIADAAVVSGFYIGRALYNGNVVVGRVDLKTKKLIGSYGGETFSLPSYDVLIYKAKGERIVNC